MLVQPAGWMVAVKGDNYWTIARRLGYPDDPLKSQVAVIIQNANAGDPIWPDTYVLIPAGLPPVAPPPLTLDRYPDHLRALSARLVAEHLPPEQVRTQIVWQTDRIVANLEQTMTALAAAGVDPATIDLDQRHNPSDPVEFDGPQNIEPGTVLRSPVFNNVVQHRGDENSPPVIYIDARHTGSPFPYGECFKTYSADAPSIHIRTLVEPTNPHRNLNAIRGHHVTAICPTVRATVDAFWPMDTRTGKRTADMFLYRPVVEKLSFFADGDDPRPEGVHGDGSQWPYSSGFYIVEGDLDGLKHPDYGPGVDVARKWYPEMNAGFMLGSTGKGLTTDPPSDMFSMATTWSRWRTGWNLSKDRPLDPPVVSLGDVFRDNPVGDVIIPDALRDHIHLIGATNGQDGTINIKYWN